MRYILTLLSIMSFSLQAAEPSKDDQVRSIIAKLRDYAESYEASMEDALQSMANIPSDYECRKSQSTPEDAIAYYRDLFSDQNLTEKGLLDFVNIDLPRRQGNLKSPQEMKRKIEVSQKYKAVEGQATCLFEHLIDFRHHFVARYTEERTRGLIPSADPARVNEIRSSISRISAETALAIYHQNLYFLKKLYPFINPAYLTEDCRRRLILDKHLRDILEGRINDYDHPETGYETLPHPQHISRLFSDQVPQATEKTSPKELKRIEGALSKRPTILIYFTFTPYLYGGNYVIDSEGHIDFDALSQIPPQDQLSKLINQVRIIRGSEAVEIFRKEYEDWQRRTRPQPLPPRAAQPPRETTYRKLPTSQPDLPSAALVASAIASATAETPTPQITHHPAIEPKPEHVQVPTIRVEGHEKDRDARRAAWEAKQVSEDQQDPSAEISAPHYTFSEATINTLKTLFKISSPASLKWDDFVSAWKELRFIIDGVRDSEVITKSGSARKFEGGAIQEGRKHKARSFVIHEPHKSDGHTLGLKAQERIAKLFEEKFGWTRDKINLN